MGEVIKWPRPTAIGNCKPGPTHEGSTDEIRLNDTSRVSELQHHNHHVVEYYYDTINWCTVEFYQKLAMRKMIDELRHQRGLPRT